MFRSKIPQIVGLIRQECHPKLIILFGSYARGEETPASDLDIMVILKEVHDRRKDMARLQKVLFQQGIRADVLVVSEELFKQWCDTPGSVYFEAAQEGKVLFNEQAA
jgi:predicted nucleotidyltransferase